MKKRVVEIYRLAGVRTDTESYKVSGYLGIWWAKSAAHVIGNARFQGKEAGDCNQMNFPLNGLLLDASGEMNSYVVVPAQR
jgi:hypothetical protein